MTPTRLHLSALAVGLVLAASACGGGDDTTTAATEAAPAATAAPTTVGDSGPGDTLADTNQVDPTGSVAATPDDPQAMMLAYSQCMRDNGVPNFPDPSADGGLSIDGETIGMDVDAPQFKAADEACKDLMPMPEGGDGPDVDRDKLLAYSQCMRDEGITAYPDPKPNGGLEVDGNAVGFGTPQFIAADEACKHLLPEGGEGGSLSEMP